MSASSIGFTKSSTDAVTGSGQNELTKSEMIPLVDDVPDIALLALLRASSAEDLAVAAEILAHEWLGAKTVVLYWLDNSRNSNLSDSGELISLAQQAAKAAQQIDENASPATEIEALVHVATPLSVRHKVAAVFALELPQAQWAKPEVRARHGRCLKLLQERLVSVQTAEELRRSVARLEQAERLQRALYAIADQASSERDMSEVLQSLHYIVGTLMYAENFYIVLYDQQRDMLRFPYFVDVYDPNPPNPERDISMDEIRHSPTWHLIRQGQALMGSPNALSAVVDGPVIAMGPDCVDWLGVPLVRGSQVVGGIVVQSYTDSVRFSAEDRTLLAYVAQHILTALERRQALNELERRVTERTDALCEANRVLQQQVLERQHGERLQAALFRIAELANTTESIDDFYAAVHRVVGGLLYARNFYIALLSDDKTELLFPYSVDEFDLHRVRRPLGTGVTDYVLRTGSALLGDQAGLEKLYASGEATSIGKRSRCWLGVPLICHDKPVGVIAVQSYSDDHRYTPRDQELLTFVSYHIANALERKRSAESLKLAYAELERRVAERTTELANANRDLREQIEVRERIERRLKHENLHDALTGLPNRNYLLTRLSRALNAYERDPRALFAVLFLDLDRFKVINDSVGHLVGDELLKDVGSRIASCLEPLDLVARLGGDEFAIVLNNIKSADEACVFAQRIIDALNAPLRLGAKEVFTSVSIGIALAASRYMQAEELLRDADVAMYRAKAEGRHRYALFDERLHQEALQLLELESDLRRAITRNEFEPFFQPIVRLNDRSIVGYEALLRWRHPERGLLLPIDFLSVAEDNGFDEQIDWQMFDAVCTVASQLTRNGGFISINLSGRHFRSAHLIDGLLAMFERHKVTPGCIRIEVTEGALLENPPAVKQMLDTLRFHGLSVTLDDFGTGYSSLSYLHQYPLHALKIDRSFVADLQPGGTNGSTAVVRAIQALAGSLEMEVIAEGIETELQCNALQELGCIYGQGFLFAQPEPANIWFNKNRSSEKLHPPGSNLN